MTGIYGQIKEKFNMRDAREDWREYRKALTVLANAHAGESIAVVGAGRCNDLDLSALMFERITLIDLDAAAMQEAVSGLLPSVREKILVRSASVTGITEADLAHFCDFVMGELREKGRLLTPDAIERCLGEGLDALAQKLPEAKNVLADLLPEEEYDVVLCNGLCSQLFSTVSFFIRSVAQSVADALCSEMAEIEANAEQRLIRMNNTVIPILDRAILRAARKAAIFGNEDPEGAPVEGASQCIRYVREHCRPKEQTLLWNFCPQQKVQYRMLLQTVTPGPAQRKER